MYQNSRTHKLPVFNQTTIGKPSLKPMFVISSTGKILELNGKAKHFLRFIIFEANQPIENYSVVTNTADIAAKIQELPKSNEKFVDLMNFFADIAESNVFFITENWKYLSPSKKLFALKMILYRTQGYSLENARTQATYDVESVAKEEMNREIQGCYV